MEPPCEHGGVLTAGPVSLPAHRLQWSRRVNTAECPQRAPPADDAHRASMEPPCEHGGVRAHAVALVPGFLASMEPPCEHGGVSIASWTQPPLTLLQWSRRVNTAEWPGKPRVGICRDGLQWSRRVNTAECGVSGTLRATNTRFNGAAV